MALNLGSNHFVAHVLDCNLHVSDRPQQRLHGIEAIHALLLRGVEIRDLRSIEIQVALRIKSKIAVNRRTLQGYDLLGEAIQRTSCFLRGASETNSQQKGGQ